MKKSVIFAAALSAGVLEIGAAQAQTPPAPAPAAAAPAPAPAPTSPVSLPSMSSTLAGNVKPEKIEAGPLGDLYITGQLSGIALWQSNPAKAGNSFGVIDQSAQVDLSNAQVEIQKVDGPIQFYLQGGAYSFPVVGVPYVRAGKTTSEFFGPLPEWFVKYAFSDALNVQVGYLPTLIGGEYAFTFENLNIQRGLIWNQENIINRGVQVNYTSGPLAVSVAWTDGFFSNRYNWFTGLATYTIGSADTVAFSAGGAVNTATPGNTTVAPVLQDNSSIYNLVYTHTAGPLTLSPTLQYTSIPNDTRIGTTESAHTFGAGVYGVYAMDGGYSVAARVEYLTSSGNKNDPANPNVLGYGGGSNAWSFTLTPAWQIKSFFVRAEASYVKATSTTAPTILGSGNATSQARLMAESGFIF